MSDWISLGVLASWVPRDAVDEAVQATGKGAKRKGGKLPPHVMVYFVMALALFAEEDYQETWVRLSETLADWGCWDSSQGTVTTGGLTQARQRLGHEPVREVFAQVARPVATEDTPGAFLGPWRKMSIDGLEWDIPDTAPNAAVFGYPGTGKDDAPAAFPKARAVTIGECASHAPVLAAIGPCVSKGSGEQSLARGLYPQLEEDWLLIADRNFYNWQDWCTAADTGAALLWRVKADLTLDPLEFYPDGSYRSVLVNPKVRGKARDAIREAARAGEDLDPDKARYVRVVEYEGSRPRGRRERRDHRPDHHHHRVPGRPRRRPRAGLPRKVGARDRERPAQDLPPRPGKGPALRIPGRGQAGDLGLPAHPLRDQRPDLHRRHERRHRPRPGEIQAHRPHHPPPGL